MEYTQLLRIDFGLFFWLCLCSKLLNYTIERAADSSKDIELTKHMAEIVSWRLGNFTGNSSGTSASSGLHLIHDINRQSILAQREVYFMPETVRRNFPSSLSEKLEDMIMHKQTKKSSNRRWRCWASILACHPFSLLFLRPWALSSRININPLINALAPSQIPAPALPHNTSYIELVVE